MRLLWLHPILIAKRSVYNRGAMRETARGSAVKPDSFT
jgi:hypothetical protein